MKSVNIVKRLEKEGYKIVYKKWGYWDNIPHVKLKEFEFAIAEPIHLEGGWQGINLDFIYNHVQHALNLAKINNPTIFKKIKEGGDWTYGLYLIRNMEDYYRYKKKKYPFNEYWRVLEKIEKEFNK